MSIKTPPVVAVELSHQRMAANIPYDERLPGYGCIFPTAVFVWDDAPRLDISISEEDLNTYPEETLRLAGEMESILTELMETTIISSSRTDMQRLKYILPYLNISEIIKPSKKQHRLLCRAKVFLDN